MTCYLAPILLIMTIDAAANTAPVIGITPANDAFVVTGVGACGLVAGVVMAVPAGDVVFVVVAWGDDTGETWVPAPSRAVIFCRFRTAAGNPGWRAIALSNASAASLYRPSAASVSPL